MARMNVSNSTATRRAFLSRLAAGSAAAVALPLVEAPTSILAAKDVPDPRAFPPYFAAGILVEVVADHIGIHAPGYLPGVLHIALTAQTQVCARGSCAADWTALKRGDRIESATMDGPDGVRQAIWVNANVIAGWGTITAITGNVLTVAQWMQPATTRTIVVQANTTVGTPQGTTTTGSVAALQVGDELHFTALADDPNLYTTSTITGVMLHRLDKTNA